LCGGVERDGAVRDRVGSLGDFRGGEVADVETVAPRVRDGGIGFAGKGGRGGVLTAGEEREEREDDEEDLVGGEGGGRGFSKSVSREGGNAPVLLVVPLE